MPHPTGQRSSPRGAGLSVLHPLTLGLQHFRGGHGQEGGTQPPRGVLPRLAFPVANSSASRCELRATLPCCHQKSSTAPAQLEALRSVTFFFPTCRVLGPP